MVLDPTISAGSIIQILIFIAGIIWFMMRQGTNILYMKKELEGVQTEIKSLAGVVTRMALADERISNVSKRLSNVENDVRELRHGKGFIQGERGIDKEWGK